MVSKKDDRIKELEDLSPEERIAKLKEIEAEDKKEIERAHELIRESEQELVNDERIKRDKPPERGEIKDFNTSYSEESLEETVAKEKIIATEEQIKQQHDYFRGLKTEQIEQRAEYLQNKIQESGYISNEQRNEITSMYQEIKGREEGIKSGSYQSASQNIEGQLSVTKKILGDMYKR
jgi:hypothetical protein